MTAWGPFAAMTPADRTHVPRCEYMPTANQFECLRKPLAEVPPGDLAGAFQLDESEQQALSDARRALLPAAGRIVEEFYRQLCAMPEAPQVLRNERRLQSLKSAMRRWIEEALLRPSSGPRSRRRLERIGVCHLRTGVSLSDIVKAFATMQRVCRDALREAVRAGRLEPRSYPAVLEALRKRLCTEQLGFVAAYLKDLTGSVGPFAA